MTTTAYLSAPEYVLGEHRDEYLNAPVLAEKAMKLSLPLQPQVWGWGAFFRTERSVADLAADSARRTLDAAAVAPATVDGLIACTTAFPRDVESHAPYLGRLLTAAGLPAVSFAAGVTLNRCNNMLAALTMATALVRSGTLRTVLVVTADRVREEADRLESFALFSDGAASCVVADRPLGTPSFAVLDCAAEQNTAALVETEQIDSRLAAKVTARLCATAGVVPCEIAALLTANLVRPLLNMKERQAGMAVEQLRTANIERVGHCFAADPVLNLVDLVAARDTTVGAHYLLAASVPGARHGVLLRRTA